MIPKSPIGISPDVNLVVGGIVFDYSAILRSRLLLEQNMHDLLELEIAGLDPELSADYWGKPVRMTIGTGGNFFFEFVGYVDVVKPLSNSSFGLVNGSPFYSSKVICMGASYALRGTRTRSWEGFNPHEIVSAIALNHGFSASCLVKERTFDHFLQAGESDWGFLSRLANLYGLAVNVHGTHLHVYDPFLSRSRLPSIHSLFTLNSAGGDQTPAPGQILEFSADLTRKMPEQVSVLADNGEVIDLGGFLSYGELSRESFAGRTGTHDTTIAQGLQRVEASKRLRKSIDTKAFAKVVGVAGAVPGGVVNVTGYSKSIDGFWYVRIVEHFIERGTFFTELHLERVASGLETTNVATFERPPGSVFVNGSWNSVTRSINAYT